MRLPTWLRDEGPWWGPYLGVVIVAGAAVVLLGLVVLAHAAEIMRTLRPAGV